MYKTIRPKHRYWLQRWQHEDLKPFPYLMDFCCRAFPAAERGLPLHTHPAIEIHYIWKGRYRWEVDGRQHTVKQGEAFITLPWQEHGGIHAVRDAGIYSWLQVRPASFSKKKPLRLGSWAALSAGESAEIGRCFLGAISPVIADGGRIAELMEDAYAELAGKRLGYISRFNFLICDILLQAARQQSGGGVTSGRAVDIRDFRRQMMCILSAIDKPWPAADVARVFGVSRKALDAVILRHTGLSPHAFVMSLRIDAAIAMLRRGDELSAIAFACGFSSQQHFSSYFKRSTGFTPRSYRERTSANGSVKRNRHAG